ncbi:phosphotransferase family protein [Steroidobacter flavus]|uniref:Phosphotransferase family protein n=1 Tax=Steroidobacter flavus TaxID=1842136 RepID=A0ABV8SX66_9GAMM
MSAGRVHLDGGVASDVAIVRDEEGRELVVKQALPKLKVAADWRCDPARSSQEVAALRVAPALLGSGVVPQVLWVDAANHRFAMERIDPGLGNWQAQLSGGEVDLVTAARVGELLARLQCESARDSSLAIAFGTREYFELLRIQPFFVRAAEMNPAAREPMDRVIELLRAPGRVLVHGDYSPKNILARGARVVILDWEVVHWGEPRFDIAFCLSHLLLTGWRRDSSKSSYYAACHAFTGGYARHGPIALHDTVLARVIGALVLARLDGDSPVNFLDELDVEEVRRRALRLLLEPAPSWLELFDRLLY